MHLMYVDESGDPGLGEGSSARYIRVGVVVHGWKWREVDERIRTFKLTRGLNWDAEIRANDIRRGHNAFARMPATERLTLLQNLLETVAREMPAVSLIGVCIHKHNVDTTKKERLSNPAVRSIELLLESYNNFLSRQRDRCGIVVLDELEARHDANIRISRTTCGDSATTLMVGESSRARFFCHRGVRICSNWPMYAQTFCSGVTGGTSEAFRNGLSSRTNSGFGNGLNHKKSGQGGRNPCQSHSCGCLGRSGYSIGENRQKPVRSPPVP